MTTPILRVFPRRTSYTPTDDLSVIGRFDQKGNVQIPMFRPEADEVHISCTFTWDKTNAERLRDAWGQYYPIVKLGGAAMGSKINGFTPGMYVKPGITFTSRGCNNQCPWCFVPKYEGKLSEYENPAIGHIVGDNNLLQCSKSHIEKVFAMLRSQKKINFNGGLQTSLITDWVIEQLESLKIDQLFLACDTDGALPSLQKAAAKLHNFKRDQLRCFVMIGRNETIQQAEARLISVWEAGCLPFSQLFQPEEWIDYTQNWQDLNRNWSRPAITKTIMRLKRLNGGF